MSNIFNQRGSLPIIVVVLLLVVGLGGGAYYYFTNKSTTSPEPVSQNQKQEAPRELTLELLSPNDQTLIADGTVMVEGKTLPNTTVVFFTDSDENSVTSDANGVFKGELMLEGGINSLTVTAYGEDGNEKSVTADVVYDEES